MPACKLQTRTISRVRRYARLDPRRSRRAQWAAKYGLGFLTIAVIVGAYWIYTLQPQANQTLTPPPPKVLAALWTAIANGSLFVNIGWSLLFFRLRRPDWALIEVLCLEASILALVVATWRISALSGVLMLPYLAWVAFATTGDPSTPALGPWPAYDTDRRATMRLDIASAVVEDPHGDERIAWTG